MMPEKKRNMLIYAVWMVCTCWSLFSVRNKLTYIEFQSMNSANEAYIEIKDTEDRIIQQFYMPYDIFYGVSIQIGTFERDNNSIWKLELVEQQTQSVIYEEVFHAGLIPDNSYYLLRSDKNIRVKQGEVYELHIMAQSVSQHSSLAFYRSDADVLRQNSLYVNGAYMDADLCFKVYGGEADLWWTGFAAVCALVILAVLRNMLKADFLRKKIREDPVCQCLALAVFVFLLLCTFSVAGTFTDENDNFRGGMIIARGGVLYKDYITQHTPVAYYICALFALLGAGSVQQFRLSYYFATALIWGCLYIRHAPRFGKKIMYLIAIAESVLIPVVVPLHGAQVLSDGIQGICMVILLLEFLAYYQDRTLGWSRAWIVSACIWGSFGSAFVSVYALVWIVGAVLVLEFLYWRKKKVSVSGICFRYYRLITAVMLPALCAVIYLAVNHALREAFQQAYVFNTQVYARYLQGFGSRPVQPFIEAVQNFFHAVAGWFLTLFTQQAANVTIVQLVLLTSAATAAALLFFAEKRRVEAFTLFAAMICSATRGYEAHGLAAWYLAILIICLYADGWKMRLKTKEGSVFSAAVAVLLTILLLSTYTDCVGDYLLTEQAPVSDVESEVISKTEPGEGIMIDAYGCDSLYFLYKDRYPVNRMVYMLPWYMDWYEAVTIHELYDYRPDIVVFNPEQDTWGYTHYANILEMEIKKNYTRLSGFPVWIRKTDP